MDNWRVTLKIGTLLMFVSTVYPGQMCAQQASAVDLKSASGDFKTVFTKAMTHAAEQAKTPIISDEIAVATKHNIVVANAVVADMASTGRPAPLMFAYISMPGTACANAVVIEASAAEADGALVAAARIDRTRNQRGEGGPIAAVQGKVANLFLLQQRAL